MLTRLLSSIPNQTVLRTISHLFTLFATLDINTLTLYFVKFFGPFALKGLNFLWYKRACSDSRESFSFLPSSDRQLSRPISTMMPAGLPFIPWPEHVRQQHAGGPDSHSFSAYYPPGDVSKDGIVTGKGLADDTENYGVKTAFWSWYLSSLPISAILRRIFRVGRKYGTLWYKQIYLGTCGVFFLSGFL